MKVIDGTGTNTGPKTGSELLAQPVQSQSVATDSVLPAPSVAANTVADGVNSTDGTVEEELREPDYDK